MRPTLRYRVIDCVGKGLWEVAEPLIRRLVLPPASRGVINVRSYAQGESVAEEMDCPFYKATATDKEELLEEWAGGSGGWIVATGALGTGIDISGVIYIIHLGRPYGLTSFKQQAGRGGRSGEISDSVVILPSSNGQFPVPRQELIDTYSVEAEDEEALTEYLGSSSCRRAVLARHLDGRRKGADCLSTDGILCDRCQESLEPEGQAKSETEEDGSSIKQEDGVEAIHQALAQDVQRDEHLEQFHQLLNAHCIFCQLMRVEGEEYSHRHQDCPYAEEKDCSIMAYQRWRSRLKLAERDQCFRCGLSQTGCTAIEDEGKCTYTHLMLPGIFFLHQVEQLEEICQEVGFRGGQEWQWQWLIREGEGLFG